MMGKALIVGSSAGSSFASGDEANWFGYGSDTSTEANTQSSCTEAATFSVIGGRVLSGNSGTATFRFRDTGANGNQTFAITGTGANEDATNTDILAAGDLFNVNYSDTGTNSTLSWRKANVEFSSGHGNFHGAAAFNGNVHDVQSTTRFIALSGGLGLDGIVTENNAEYLIRSYDSFEALQVRVKANARLNTSTFRNRI